MVKRNMIHTKRMPEMLSDVTVQPIMFVLLFAFVFGASIAPAAAPRTASSCCPASRRRRSSSRRSCGVGITADVEKGIIDRFRSLPIARSSVLIGRSVASLLHSSLGVVVMAVTGLAIGWRIRGGVAEAVLAFALILVFGFSMIWFGILIGSVMRSVEAVNGVMFTVLFPITFLANTFAPTEPMQHWLRVIAEWNPVSSLAPAMRELVADLAALLRVLIAEPKRRHRTGLLLEAGKAHPLAFALTGPRVQPRRQCSPAVHRAFLEHLLTRPRPATAGRSPR